jgi:hypothetical protein
MLDVKSLEVITNVLVIGSIIVPAALRVASWMSEAAQNRHAPALSPLFTMDRRKAHGCRCDRKQPDPNPGRFRASDGYGPLPVAA